VRSPAAAMRPAPTSCGSTRRMPIVAFHLDTH
jgi:hypothetical protein